MTYSPVTAADSPTPAETVSVPSLWIGTSILVSVLVTITSLCGILLEQTYARETHAYAIQAVSQDYANLVVVVLLLVSSYYVRNHSLKWYLVWLGIYLYLLYTYLIYAMSLHFQFLFLAYVAILGLSFYTLVGGLMAAHLDMLAPALRSNSKAKMVSVFFFVVGVLFALLWLSDIVPNLIAGTFPPSLTEEGLGVNPVHVLDLAFMIPGLIIASVLLWRREVIGTFMAVPLLVFLITMMLALIIMVFTSAGGSMLDSLPPIVIFGIIMVLGMLFSWSFLKEVNEAKGVQPL